MNVGIALVGIVGGVIVGVGLVIQQRRERALDADLVACGTISPASVAAVVSVGRNAAFRRVTFAIDADGARVEVTQTFGFVEAGELGLVAGSRVQVRHLTDAATGVVRGRLVQTAGPPTSMLVPIGAGLFIAVLGIAAALAV